MGGTSVNTDRLVNQGLAGYAGQKWLVEERDACGVGFIADQRGNASHDLVKNCLLYTSDAADE